MLSHRTSRPSTRRTTASTPYSLQNRSAPRANTEDVDMNTTIDTLPSVLLDLLLPPSSSSQRSGTTSSNTTNQSGNSTGSSASAALAKHKRLRRARERKAARDVDRFMITQEAIFLGLIDAAAAPSAADTLDLATLKAIVHQERERRKNPRALRRGIKFIAQENGGEGSGSRIRVIVPAASVGYASLESGSGGGETVVASQPRVVVPVAAGPPQKVVMPSAPGKATRVRKNPTSAENDDAGDATDEDSDADTDIDTDDEEEEVIDNTIYEGDRDLASTSTSANASAPTVSTNSKTEDNNQTSHLLSIPPPETNQQIVYQQTAYQPTEFDRSRLAEESQRLQEQKEQERRQAQAQVDNTYRGPQLGEYHHQTQQQQQQQYQEQYQEQYEQQQQRDHDEHALAHSHLTHHAALTSPSSSNHFATTNDSNQARPPDPDSQLVQSPDPPIPLQQAYGIAQGTQDVQIERGYGGVMAGEMLEVQGDEGMDSGFMGSSEAPAFGASGNGFDLPTFEEIAGSQLGEMQQDQGDDVGQGGFMPSVNYEQLSWNESPAQIQQQNEYAPTNTQNQQAFQVNVIPPTPSPPPPFGPNAEPTTFTLPPVPSASNDFASQPPIQQASSMVSDWAMSGMDSEGPLPPSTMEVRADELQDYILGEQQKVWAEAQAQAQLLLQCVWAEAQAQLRQQPCADASQYQPSSPPPPPPPSTRAGVASQIWGRLSEGLGDVGATEDQQQQEEGQSGSGEGAPSFQPELVETPLQLTSQQSWWGAVAANESSPISVSTENRRRRVKERGGVPKRPMTSSKEKKMRRRVYHLPGDGMDGKEKKEVWVDGMDEIDEEDVEKTWYLSPHPSYSFSSPAMEEQQDDWVNPAWLNEGRAVVGVEKQEQRRVGVDFISPWKRIKGLFRKVVPTRKTKEERELPETMMSEEELYQKIAREVCAEHGLFVPPPTDMVILLDDDEEGSELSELDE